MKIKNAEFKCMKCRYTWVGLPGPALRPPREQESNPDTICPFCGSVYIEWTNYIEDFQR